ncbi:N-acetyltransferase [Holzapfeliella sp. He02]|uniref:N-acetyltransferase n=1 Tax=Holzapfeliella saturejae TaxID=3082953 RepID=A0ABU8SGU5_9LACO
MIIRTIKPQDYKAVDQLIRTVFTQTEFGYGEEAELVDKIRASKEDYISELEIVATQDNDIIGHGLLSKVNIQTNQNSLTGLVLAPIEVALNYQKSGVGKEMMQVLESRAKELNYPYISILGHPSYYAKFGYVPAKQYGVKPPFEVPEDAFLIKPLSDGALTGVEGTLRYSAAFS